MRLSFKKMHGAGNDFLFYDSLDSEPPQLYAREIQFLCDRQFGVGADGLVILRSTRNADAAWTFFNCDGSEAEMCGNAARCAIRYLTERYYPDATEPISLETRAGIIRGKMTGTDQVEITLLARGGQRFDYEQLAVKVDQNVFDGYSINTGVPHYVMEVRDIETYPIAAVGKLLVRHAAFPKGSNITFFQKISGNKIKSTTFERGVEKETFACGTGVAAAAIMYSQLYMQQFPIDVSVPGGDLQVDFSPVSKMLLLRGPAEHVMTTESFEIPSHYSPRALFGERKREV